MNAHLQIFKHLLYFVFLQNIMERVGSFNNFLSSFITYKNAHQDAHKTLSLVQQIELKDCLK